MRELLRSVRALLFFTIVLGLVYPLAITAVSQLAFRSKSNGSLIERDQKVVGSELIAQKFIKPEYFWSRPSSSDFNANPSGASNLGPTSGDLKKQIGDRRADLSKSFGVPESQLAQELITASGSGLDPHITAEGAKIQILRIVKARNWPQSAIDRLNRLVDSLTEKPTLGILGESRVNVLKLNLALQELKIENP